MKFRPCLWTCFRKTIHHGLVLISVMEMAIWRGDGVDISTLSHTCYLCNQKKNKYLVLCFYNFSNLLWEIIFISVKTSSPVNRRIRKCVKIVIRPKICNLLSQNLIQTKIWKYVKNTVGKSFEHCKLGMSYLDWKYSERCYCKTNLTSVYLKHILAIVYSRGKNVDITVECSNYQCFSSK